MFDRLNGSGLEASTDPDSFAPFIRDDEQKWPPVVKASGAKVDSPVLRR